MIRESCIKHPTRNPTVVLRADYLRLCDGDHCAAMILSQHEHWHNVKLDNRQQAREHNKSAARGSEQPTQDVELWVYQAQLAMKGQLMGLFGDKAITTGYKTILDKGFLQKRTNPRFTWDKTLQYLFMVDRVQATVDAVPLLPDEDEAAQNDESAELRGSRAQKCALDAAEMRFPERKDADSITQKCATPKTSSETSPQITITTAPSAPEGPQDSVVVKPAKRIQKEKPATLEQDAAIPPLPEAPSAASATFSGLQELLLAELVSEGMGEGKAKVAVRDNYYMAVDQLENLRHALPTETLTPASRGAWLHVAIRDGYGHTKGYAQYLDGKKEDDRRKVACERREAAKQAESEAEQVFVERMELTPEAAAALRQKACNCVHPDFRKRGEAKCKDLIEANYKQLLKGEELKEYSVWLAVGSDVGEPTSAGD